MVGKGQPRLAQASTIFSPPTSYPRIAAHMISVHVAEDIAARLVRRFPPSNRPELRLALYERLGRLCEDSESGGMVYNLVAAVAADAVGKRDPGRYFAKVVMLRLRESNLLPSMEI